jgi:hypothetical protein
MGTAVDYGGVHQTLLVLTEFRILSGPEETRYVSLVTRGAGLLDENQNGIGIAVDPYIDQLLSMTALLTLPPQLVSRTAVVCHPTCLDGFQVRFSVHPGEHEDLEGLRVLSDDRQESVGTARKIRFDDRHGRVIHS